MPRNSDEDNLVSDAEAQEEEEEPLPRLQDAANVEDAPPTAAPAASETGRSGGNSWFILEPAVFLLFMARNLTGAVYTNQILYQTCLTIFGYNETQCSPLLGIHRETEEAKIIETTVQPYVSHISMTISLLESIMPALVSLFLGPWSDKFGRRPVLLSTFSGYLISNGILLVIATVSTKTNISPWWFILPSVPSTLSGGTCALITGLYCYISDVAKERKRAMRMVLNEVSICTGMMVGNVASSYIYAATDALTIFLISGALQLFALLYVVIFIKESLRPEEIQSGSRLREFFRFDLVIDLVRTCFKRRPHFDRAIIWLTMIALTVAIFVQEGESPVTYLFLRTKFDWTINDYTLFSSARMLIQMVGGTFGMILLRRVFKFSLVSMAMLAMASCVLESTVRATATIWWELYAGTFLGMMRGILGPMCRALLSHVAPGSEVGKIFALTTSLESLSPLMAAPIYVAVYNSTITTYPSAFNFISAGLFFLCYTLITAIFGIQKSMDSSTVYKAIGS